MNWQLHTPQFDYDEISEDKLKHWAGHRYFAYDLIRNTKPKVIVELGAYLGVSFFSFCKAIQDEDIDSKLCAIDTWKGDIHMGEFEETVYSNFIKIKDQLFGDLNIKIIRKEFDDAVADFKDNSIDLLHIDGCHTYEAVKNDFTKWKSKVKSDGIILFHDIYETNPEFGVNRFWNEIKKLYPTLEFTHSHGLGVLFIKEPKNTNLFNPTQTDLFQNYYSTLNNVYELKIKLKETNDLLDNVRENNKHLHNTIHNLETEIQIYKNNYIAIQNSLTWKITTIIRKPFYLINLIKSKLPISIAYIRKFGLISFVKYLIALINIKTSHKKTIINNIGNIEIGEFNSKLTNQLIKKITANNFIINILHSNFTVSLGGTEKYVIEDIEQLNSQGINTITIFPDAENFGIILNQNYVVKNVSPEELRASIKKLNKLQNLKFFALHHLYRYNINQAKILIDCIDPSKLIVFTHDIFLIDPDTFYKQNDYNLTNPPDNSSKEKLRELYRSMVKTAKLIICPSDFMADKIKTAFDDKTFSKVKIQSHVKLRPYNKKVHRTNKKYRIAYLGHDSASKGWMVFKKISKSAQINELLDFYHIGKCYNPANMSSDIINIDYSFYDGHSYAAVRELLNHDIDIVFLWSLLPESFNYAMYEAQAAAIPIITSLKSGNIHRQVMNKNVYGITFENDDELCKFLNSKEKIADLIKKNPNTHTSYIEHNSTLTKLLKGEHL